MIQTKTVPVTSQMDIPGSVRKIVYDRDGDSCRVCGSYQKLEIHHIVPRGLGRYHDYCNLILLCSVCHDAVEGGRLPHWHTDSIEKLYHISPVRAYMHFINFDNITCKTHSRKLSEEIVQPPIRAYSYVKGNPVFS